MREDVVHVFLACEHGFVVEDAGTGRRRPRNLQVALPTPRRFVSHIAASAASARPATRHVCVGFSRLCLIFCFPGLSPVAPSLSCLPPRGTQPKRSCDPGRTDSAAGLRLSRPSSAPALGSSACALVPCGSAGGGTSARFPWSRQAKRLARAGHLRPRHPRAAPMPRHPLNSCTHTQRATRSGRAQSRHPRCRTLLRAPRWHAVPDIDEGTSV